MARNSSGKKIRDARSIFETELNRGVRFLRFLRRWIWADPPRDSCRELLLVDGTGVEKDELAKLGGISSFLLPKHDKSAQDVLDDFRTGVTGIEQTERGITSITLESVPPAPLMDVTAEQRLDEILIECR